ALDCPGHRETLRREETEKRRDDILRLAVDEREVEAVTHAHPVEARLRQRKRLLMRGRAVDVEDASAFGVGERADAVLGREPRKRSRRLAAPPEYHEWNESRHGHQDTRPFPVRRAHQADGASRQS